MKNDKRSNQLDAFVFSIDKILQIHFQILLTYRVMHLHKFHKLEFCKKEKNPLVFSVSEEKITAFFRSRKGLIRKLIVIR